jgi:hypothetical protein
MMNRAKVKRRTFLKKHKVLLLFLVCACACLLTFFLVNRTGETVGPVPTAELIGKFEQQPEMVSEPAGELRAVFPYSVIPGGVQSGEELAAHVAFDKVVADHYSDFNVNRARIVKADKTRMMYVSYRVNDTVYWTQNKVQIPEGELLVTDGECEGRARCGNRVSASPQVPVFDEEPMVEVFDIPQYVHLNPPGLTPLPDLAYQFNPLVPPSQLPIGSQAPIGLTSKGSDGVPVYSPFSSQPFESIDVPEPGILTLLVLGIIALFGFKFFHKK